jgi:hypothetical protein
VRAYRPASTTKRRPMYATLTPEHCRCAAVALLRCTNPAPKACSVQACCGVGDSAPSCNCNCNCNGARSSSESQLPATLVDGTHAGSTASQLVSICCCGPSAWFVCSQVVEEATARVASGGRQPAGRQRSASFVCSVLPKRGCSFHIKISCSDYYNCNR